MSRSPSADENPIRVRRPPPPLRRIVVRRVELLNPHMARVTFGGAELEGLTANEPAASVRLLIPSPGTTTLVMPSWNGNEFLLPDGRRPTIRTFTPRRVDPEVLELDLDVVVHEGGAVSAWVGGVGPGAAAAVSGTGRGYTVDRNAPAFLLAGDQTAIPAISQIIGALPRDKPVQVIVEIVDAEAKLDLPEHPRLHTAWTELPEGRPPGAALVAAVEQATLDSGVRVWAAGEAAAMHRIRSHLFDERALDRGDVTVRGYWKHGR